jgi:tetratricopeptide (TPR) repeat protein
LAVFALSYFVSQLSFEEKWKKWGMIGMLFFFAAQSILLVPTWRDTAALGNYVLKHSPKNQTALSIVGKIHVTKKEYKKAYSYFERSYNINPEGYPKGLMIDVVCWERWRLQKYRLALECFDTAIKFEPRFAQHHWNRSIALSKLGRAEEAKRSFLQATALNSKLWRLRRSGLILSRSHPYIRETAKCSSNPSCKDL